MGAASFGQRGRPGQPAGAGSAVGCQPRALVGKAVRADGEERPEDRPVVQESLARVMPGRARGPSAQSWPWGAAG